MGHTHGTNGLSVHRHCTIQTDIGVGHGAGRGAGRQRGGGIGLAELVTEPGWEKAEDTQPPVLQPFREATGPTEPLPYDARAIDFFSKMVEDDFFEKLADATNANAVGQPAPLTNNANATSDPHWQSTTAAEMRAFVGLNIAMGVKDLPEYYWSDETVLHDAFVVGVMSRCRYEKLVQYFHCSLPADDKLAKVRMLLSVHRELSPMFCSMPMLHT